ncbi:MAG: TerB family tellurite resistance protein [Chryseolinea sp.]
MEALNQLKLLISLAQIDGVVALREKNFIVNIGRANNLYPDQIDSLFERSHNIVLPQDLTDDEKFSYLISMVQLMKIDERMYKEELIFCRTIATTLGYEPQALAELLVRITSDAMSDDEIAALKSGVQKYLKS